MTVSETHNGFTWVDFNEEVAGYNLQSYATENGNESVYHLTAWTTTWHDLKKTGKIAPIVLNPSGEQVETVYYYQTNEAADQLIYGEDQHANGGIITLPRLSLNYLSGLAAIVLFVCVGILFTVRSNEIYFKRMIKIAFVPLSYLFAQLLVTGWNTATYSLLRDFSSILLVAILFYGLFWIGAEIVKKWTYQ